MILAELIPEQFFLARGDLLLWLLAVVAIALLVYGADRLVGSAVHLARAVGLSTVIIGATIVSLGTTSPEACVSVLAAIGGKPGLALGNAVGSIICDTALVFGLCCCVVKLPKDRFILRRHGWLQLGSGILLACVVGVLAIWAGGIEGVMIPRFIGMIFLGLLVGYMAISVRWARQHPALLGDEAHAGEGEKILPSVVLKHLVLLVVGLVLVLVGSDVMVGSVGELCLRYGVPADVLAVTLVAFGTSLPELVTAIASIIKGHPELLVGNVIGADILNVLFVVGASATAIPLEVPPLFYYLHIPMMLLALVMLRVFIAWRGETFKRWQGIPLLLLFGGYYAILAALKLSGHMSSVVE